ncbi:MAG TPA: MarP family serine protease [Candidatus Saccharimonadales bacterium]|nr:MarP family serine protease [Candidatus Saccharimonadales bacterium]
MNLTDIIIIILVISACLRGRELGFVRQLCSTIGFFVGLYLGAALLQPYTVKLVHSPLSQSLVTIITTLGAAIILLIIGEYLGLHAKRRLQIWKVNRLDVIFGGLLGVVSLLLVVWLSAAILETLPSQTIQREIRYSAIISRLNRMLPPASTVVANLGQLIDPNGFPQVFIGDAPGPPSNVPQPSLGALQAAVDKDSRSVVKIEGQGCGGIVEGSGFVVGTNLIATNAHVVAGIRQPYVLDANGTHTAQPIWFDPDLDFAVLKVNNLAGDPLVFSNADVHRGTAGAVLGYPGGGNFEADPAAVLDEFTATGRNIYNQGETERDVYEIRAKVVPGNSGGPVIVKDGSVIGIVFAESTKYPHIGYALTNDQVTGEINQARAQDRPVSTGSCAY